MNKKLPLQDIFIKVLKNFPNSPFLCLQMSASLFVELKDNYYIKSKLITGDLLFRGDLIFKQDYKIETVKPNIFNTWSGHAWIEIDDKIADLSLIRTINSNEFTKTNKKELINFFGNNKVLIGTKFDVRNWGLSYKPIDYLNYDTALSLLKGYSSLLK